MQSKINRTEILVFSILTVGLILGLIISVFYGNQLFEEQYAVEDGIIEYGTTLFLLAISLWCFYKAIKWKSRFPTSWLLGTLFFGLLFLFGAGEEVSWGQRIIGFETPESLKDINRQDEVTLHNIRIGDFDVNKLIFSKLLTVGLILYFTVLPFLYYRWTFLTKMADKFALPIPQWHQVIFFLVATVIALLIPSEKKWEVHEFLFAGVFFLIFLYPVNKDKIG